MSSAEDTSVEMTESRGAGVQAPEAFVAVDDAAAAKVVGLLEEEADTSLGLRIAVRPGGCSGFSYEMFFDSARTDDDLAWQVTAANRSFDVIVDASSATMLKGATLRYADGFSGRGFTIDNPNAQKTCGCGSSFS